MGVSRVIRMPDLTKPEIPEKQRTFFVRDEQIFQKLRLEHRQIEDRQGGAQRGDYVLVEVTPSRGRSRKVHMEMGGKVYKELQESLLGCWAGQEVSCVIRGVDTHLSVNSVRRVVEFPLTDESIQSLQIPSISTLREYRLRYLKEHGEEMTERIFRSLQQKLLGQVLALGEMHLDQNELEHYHRRQRAMLQNISGDVEERLKKAYGSRGDETSEECDRLFFQDNKRNFAICLWGKALAEQDGVVPSEEEYRQALSYYCLAFDTTEEQVEQEGLKEEVLRSFYLQYGIGQLKKRYQSLVRFQAEGIPPQPLEDGILD